MTAPTLDEILEEIEQLADGMCHDEEPTLEALARVRTLARDARARVQAVTNYATTLRREARDLRAPARVTNADSMLSAAFETVADSLQSFTGAQP